MRSDAPLPRPVRSVLLLLAALLLAGLAAAQSQTPQRVVVLPLEGDTSMAPWALGMSTGLQRTLNTIDGLYVPPVGDAALLADRAEDADVDPIETIRETFQADVILGGRVDGDGGDTRLVLRALSGAEDAGERTVSGRHPSELLQGAASAAVELLGLDLSTSARGELERVAAQAPDTEVLSPLALASSRLPGADVGALRAAADLAADSSWVLAELARALSLGDDHEAAREVAVAATDATPSDVEAWVVRGVAARRRGDGEDARAAFEEALRLNPAHAVALTGLAEHQEGQEAIDTLERAVEAYPRLLEAHLALAERVGGARSFQRLRNGGASLPDALQLHRTVVARALEIGDAGGALEYLRTTADDPLARTPGLYALAARLPNEHLDAALAFVEVGAERFPAAPQLAVARSRLLRASGDPQAAVEVLRPVHENAPENAEVANELALALLETGADEEARGVLEAAAEGDDTVRFNLGQLLLEAGQPSTAAEELAPLAEAGSEDAEVWSTYGAALAAAGRAEAARDALQRALELDPEAPMAQQSLRRLEERIEVAGEAEVDVDAGAMRAFEDGMSALENGRWEDAVAAFERALEAEPDTPLLQFYLGTALQRAGDPRAALEAYAPAREAFGDSGTVLNNIGFAHLQLGRYDRALPTLREAVEAAPDNARAHLNLGLTLYGINRFEDALASWERAIELEPSLESSIADARERARSMVGEGGD